VYHTSDSTRWRGAGEDYEGKKNARILAKWRKLSASEETVAKIPNLIWTDIAANMFVGTKSILSALPDTQSYPVRSNKRRIFFNYTWALPGLICGTIWIIFAALYMMLYLIPQYRSRMRLSRLKDLINQLSIGRSLVVADQFNAVGVNGSTKEWLATSGQRRINLFPLKLIAEDAIEMGSLPVRDKCIASKEGCLNHMKPLAPKKSRRASV
jgi:hypothetical protein